MNSINLYVIRDTKSPQWYFQRIEDYSSMMGYLAKNHPRYTHKLTNNIRQAMHFDTPNEALTFIKKHSIEGDIIKDPYQERVIHVSSKMMGENFGEVITYIYGMVGGSNEKDACCFKSTKSKCEHASQIYERPVLNCN